MTGSIQWKGQPLPFHTGESVATALLRAGIIVLGQSPAGQPRALFCGIGQCQGCLVRIDGILREACLTPCRDGLSVMPEDGGTDV